MQLGTGVCTASHYDRRVLDGPVARGSHRALVKHWALVSRPNRLRKKGRRNENTTKLLTSSWAREEGPGSLQSCLISDARNPRSSLVLTVGPPNRG
jgi:hypothetical protein